MPSAYASPTRGKNGDPATASRNPAAAAGSPPKVGVMESMEAVQSLTQMLLGHGIDSSVPAPGHTGSKIRLPLQYFDNTDVERNTPQGWVELCTSPGGKRASSQPTAIVLLTDESGVGQWRLGRVFHWDETSSTYHVHLANALGQIQEDSTVALPRLSICFLAEPMHEFAQRVAAPQHVHHHSSAVPQGGTRRERPGGHTRLPFARCSGAPVAAGRGGREPWRGAALVGAQGMHTCTHTCTRTCTCTCTQAAHRARDETEAKLLFRFYVTNMPTGDMRTLNELQAHHTHTPCCLLPPSLLPAACCPPPSCLAPPTLPPIRHRL